MSSRQFPYSRALITGASAGIGAALARRLAEEGVPHLILVARRQARLDSLAEELRAAHQCQVDCIAADLSTAAGLEKTLAGAQAVDLLVNNAGFASFGRFDRLDPIRERAMIDLNCRAPVALAQGVLPGMVARGSGCVLNIASGQSFGAMPFMSTYAATKAFLLHWAEGIRAELSVTGVRVVTICPGSIDTEFNQAADIPEGEIAAISLVQGSLGGVLDACVRAILNDQGVTIPGIRNWVAVTTGRFSPRGIATWVLAKILRSGAEKAQLSGRSSSDPR
jgi:short-subunit dehydrogenase